MRRASLLAIVLLLLTLASSAPDDPFLIASGAAGPVRVRMAVEEIYNVYSRDQIKLVDLDLEGMFSPALKVESGGRSLMTAEITCSRSGWSIFRIRVEDARFHTHEGIRVGSTLAELKKAYPDLKLYADEGGVAYVKSQNLSFTFGSNPSKSDKSRVTSILVLSGA